MEEQQKMKNATLILILGIFSILTCCCYGFGLVLGIITIVLANKSMAMYNENPDSYIQDNNVKIGKILAIIGIALSIAYLIFIIYLITTFGIEALQDPEGLEQLMKEKWGLE